MSSNERRSGRVPKPRRFFDQVDEDDEEECVLLPASRRARVMVPADDGGSECGMDLGDEDELMEPQAEHDESGIDEPPLAVAASSAARPSDGVQWIISWNLTRSIVDRSVGICVCSTIS
jgi:hypothetical protein